MRTFTTVTIGFLLGAAAAAAAGFWAVTSGFLFAQFAPAIAQPKWPDVRPGGEASADGTLHPQVSDSGDVLIPVPKGVASQGYQSSLEDTISTYNELAITGEALVTALKEMNSRALSGNFDGLFDLVFEAKTLLAKQKTDTVKLAQTLAAFESEISSVTDPALATASRKMVESGKPVVDALRRYSETVEPLLSGKVPDQGAINTVYEASLSLSESSATFNKDAQATAEAVRRTLEAFSENLGLIE